MLRGHHCRRRSADLADQIERFRAEYLRYLRRQFERLTDANAPLAASFGPALKKSGVNAAIDDFEMKALSSPIEREVHARVASDGDHLFVDLGDPEWRAVRITADGWTVVESPPVGSAARLDTRPLPILSAAGRSADCAISSEPQRR